MMLDQASRPELSQIFGSRNRSIREHCAIVEPVAPPGGKSRKSAKRPARVDVESTSLGQHGAQLGHRNRTQQRINSANNPCQQDEPVAPELRRHGARQAQDADSNRAAKDYGNAESNSQNSQQSGFSPSRGRRC